MENGQYDRDMLTFKRGLREDGRYELVGEYLGEYVKTLIKDSRDGEQYLASPYELRCIIEGSGDELRHEGTEGFLTK